MFISSDPDHEADIAHYKYLLRDYKERARAREMRLLQLLRFQSDMLSHPSQQHRDEVPITHTVRGEDIALHFREIEAELRQLDAMEMRSRIGKH